MQINFRVISTAVVGFIVLLRPACIKGIDGLAVWY
jgi:hypothetical protein